MKSAMHHHLKTRDFGFDQINYEAFYGKMSQLIIMYTVQMLHFTILENSTFIIIQNIV